MDEITHDRALKRAAKIRNSTYTAIRQLPTFVSSNAPLMARLLEPEPFLSESKDLPVIDVRSPGEYMQGHIPGAVNIPLFDNGERAVVGTIYKNSGRDAAILKGMSIATPKIPQYLQDLRNAAKGRHLLVHCWRGGMRSEHMAALFEKEGYEAGVLTGGYKAYRRFVRASFCKPGVVIVIGGYTGSGKTEVLRGISGLGCQVIDLEELACHKGSAFGALGQAPQPTNEQFENNLYQTWSEFDLSEPVWFEDESRMIGRVTLPDSLVEMIGRGILVRLEVPKELRARRIVSEYAGFDKTLLSEAVSRISERLGGARTTEALEAIGSGAFDRVADNMLTYYDKAYNFANDRRPHVRKIPFDLPGGINEETPARIIAFIKEILRHGTHLS
jgi:tRNA 2-selenouridine synthase